MTSPNEKRRFGKRAMGLLLLGACAAAAASMFLLNPSRSHGIPPNEVLFAAVQGPLVISVTESATVKPREQVIISSRVEGRAMILHLISEGTRVKQGELLVELDASALIESKIEQEIRVQNSDAAFVEAKESLEVTRNQAQADIEKAELTFAFAKDDVIRYREGEFPNQVKELEARITLAQEEVQRTSEKVTWSARLYAEKYLSETELQGDRLAAQKALLDLELARNNLALLRDYTNKRKATEFESNVRQAEMALERTRRRASADIVQAEAQLLARESEFDRQKSRLERLLEQIARARITAPTDGLVVYATSAQFSWRGNVEPLATGQEVRERQELIYLPTADTFMAEVKIHESSLKKVYVGLPVRVTVDALPGSMFMGRVARIAPLPDAQSMFLNPDLKVYATEVHIDGGGDVLRTGMTCQAEILIAQYEDALHVPVQSVIRVGGTPTVFVRDGLELVARPVQIGLDNNRMVHILGGLQVGERVLLTPPLEAGSTVRDVPTLAEVDIPTRPPVGNGQASAPTAETAAPDGTAAERPAPSPEQTQRMRERLESMSPEEREAARRRWQQQRAARAAPATEGQ